MNRLNNKFIIIILCLNIICCAQTNKAQSIAQYSDSTSAETYHTKFIKTGDYNQLIKAADLYRSSNVLKAIELYNILRKSKTYELHACESLVFCYLEVDDIRAAKELVTYIFSVDATRYKPLSALALVLALTDDHQAAIDYFDLSLSIKKSPIVLNNKALTLAFIGREKESVNIIDEAAIIAGKNHPFNMTISMNQALIYGLNNMMDDAYNVLKPYLNESQIYNNIALYAILAQDTQKAKNYLYKALDSDNHYQKAERNLDILN